MEQAKCNTIPADLFDWRPNHEQNEPARAKALCDGCPVMQQCARFAHQIRPSDTIYAGIAFPPMGRGMRKGPARRAYEQLARMIGPHEKPRQVRRKPGPAPGTAVAHINARRTRCAKGHELAGDNLHEQVLENGTVKRKCLTCKRDSAREAWRRAQERRASSA